MHGHRLMKWLLLFALSSVFLVGCSDFEDYEGSRAYQALNAASGDDIVLGFVWPFVSEYEAVMYDECVMPPEGDCLPLGEWDLLPLGVHMALDEINASGGILGGRRIRLIQRDDNDAVTQARLIAQEFAENTEIVAVIGHAWSYTSVPASPLYEFNGLIMLSPSATSPDLTSREFDFIFRNLASDDEIGRQLAEYAGGQGFESMAILYVNETYGRELSNVFENEASRLGIRIVDRRAYRGSERSFDHILLDWQEREFDAIFIAGAGVEAGSFIRQARELGIDVPVIGGDAMDTSDLWEENAEAVEGVIVASHYHADNPRPELQEFIHNFEERWGMPPDTWSAQGYDALYLLAYAMNTAGTTEPEEVARVLHDTRNWQGVTGPHSFDEYGNVVGKSIILKRVVNAEFEFFRLATDSDSAGEVDIEATNEPEATAEP